MNLDVTESVFWRDNGIPFERKQEHIMLGGVVDRRGVSNRFVEELAVHQRLLSQPIH